MIICYIRSRNMQTAIMCSMCKKGQTVTDPESGEIICRNCGLVLSDKVQESRAEWRAFTSEEVSSRSRAGIPSSLARHDMGLSTVIGRTDKDAGGNSIGTDMRYRMERLKMWDSRSQMHSPSERNFQHAFGINPTRSRFD